MKKHPDDYTFFEHLDELRRRLTYCALAVILLSCIVYFYIDTILYFIVRPVGHLVFTAPADAFLVRIYTGLIGGLFLALPYLILQTWMFVASGLRDEEKKYIRIFAPFSVFLFIMGVAFAYFAAIPMAFRFLLGFSTELLVPMITVRSYVSFVGSMLLAFGVIFEVPLIIMFLVKIGIATPAFLIQKRSHAIVLILIISTLLTPPDVITQLIMAVPLMILYELGIVLAKAAYHKREIPENPS